MAAVAETKLIPEFNDEFFEWEERDEHTPLQVHMIAGSLAGVGEHCALLPLDNIKTHRQSSMTNMSIPQTFAHIRQQQGGYFNFWRGSTIMALGCIPAHALFFSMYEYSKKQLGISESENYNFNLNAAVGALSSIFHDLIILPCEGSIFVDRQ